MSDKFVRHKRVKCKNCGNLMGVVAIRECTSGNVSCEYVPVTTWKDTLAFLKMDAQDIAWRLGEAMKTDNEERIAMFRKKLSNHIDEIVEIHSSFTAEKRKKNV